MSKTPKKGFVCCHLRWFTFFWDLLSFSIYVDMPNSFSLHVTKHCKNELLAFLGKRLLQIEEHMSIQMSFLQNSHLKLWIALEMTHCRIEMLCSIKTQFHTIHLWFSFGWLSQFLVLKCLITLRTCWYIFIQKCFP